MSTFYAPSTTQGNGAIEMNKTSRYSSCPHSAYSPGGKAKLNNHINNFLPRTEVYTDCKTALSRPLRTCNSKGLFSSLPCSFSFTDVFNIGEASLNTRCLSIIIFGLPSGGYHWFSKYRLSVVIYMSKYHLQQIIVPTHSHWLLSVLHAFPLVPKTNPIDVEKVAIFLILQMRKPTPEVIQWLVAGHKFKNGGI